jgi:hypothetical protein
MTDSTRYAAGVAEILKYHRCDGDCKNCIKNKYNNCWLAEEEYEEAVTT